MDNTGNDGEDMGQVFVTCKSSQQFKEESERAKYDRSFAELAFAGGFMFGMKTACYAIEPARIQITGKCFIKSTGYEV